MAKRLRTTSALAVVVMMLVGACGSSNAVTERSGVGAPRRALPAAERSGIGRGERVCRRRAQRPSAAPAAAVPTVPTGYTELDKALGATTSRSTARRSRSRPSGSAARATNFAASVADFAKATGITIQIDSIGSSHETVLKTRIEGGKPPDMAQLAQPTPVLAYAAEGKVIDLATFMDAKKLSDEHPATIGLVTQGANIWGIPYKADVKSTIWYPIKAFAAKGYTVPTTWDELIALSDKIVADGSQPVVRQRRRPRHRDRLAAHRLGRGSRPQDQGPRLLTTTGSTTRSRSRTRASRPPWTRSARSSSRRTTSSAATRRSCTTTRRRSWTRCSTRTTWPHPKCWMQKIPTWYGPDFFPDQRASGQPSKYIVGDGRRDLPVPDHRPGPEQCRGLGRHAHDARRPARSPRRRGVPRDAARPPEAGSRPAAPSRPTPPPLPTGMPAPTSSRSLPTSRTSATGIGFDASDLMPGKVGAGTFWTKMDDWANARWHQHRRRPEGHRRQLARQLTV